MKKIKDFLKKNFITGLLVIIPVWVTFYVLIGILRWIDGWLSPVLESSLGLRFPGLGIVTLIVLILLIGVSSANYIGRKFVQLGDHVLQRVPLVSSVYTTVKQIMETFSVKHNFHGVALVEFPRKGCYSLGFMTGEVTGGSIGHSGTFVSVFVPTTPNPTGGYLLLFPEAEVTKLDMSVDQGMRFIISLGLVPLTEIEAQKLTTGTQEVRT